MDASAAPAADHERYFLVLRRALATVDRADMRARRSVYDKAVVAQKRILEARQPPADEIETEFEYRFLRQTIRIVEDDIRRGIDVFDEGYHPDGLEDRWLRLSEARAAKRAAVRRPVRLPSMAAGGGAVVEAGTDGERSGRVGTEIGPERLGDALRYLSGAAGHGSGGGWQPNRVRTLRAILILLFQMVATQSRFAIIWLLIQPAVLLSLIVLMYYMFEIRFVLNMDVPTFSLIGTATWVMVREVVVRVATTVVSNRGLLNLPHVSIGEIGFSQGLLYLCIYLCVFVILFGLGQGLGITSPPQGVLMVAVYLLGMWLLALSTGLIFGAIAAYWHFFLRFSSVLSRGMQMFSSVYFVSEQLPEDYRHLILWSPTAHGMQLLRTAYFANYVSADAEARYFWTSVLLMALAGVVATRLAATRLQPA